MPHLSPIIWFSLYLIVWSSFLLSFISLEFTTFSLNR